jgi:hypothetical protein
MRKDSSQPNLNTTTDTELSEDQLDGISAGIIIVGGTPSLYQQTSRINLVALNPQPLPPRYRFTIGNQGF